MTLEPTDMLKGKNKRKSKSVDGEVLSTSEKKAAGINREKVGLATPSPTPTPAAAGKGTLAAIRKLYGFTLGGDVEGYETVASDLDSVSTSSIVSAIFTVGRVSGGEGKGKEDTDGESHDGSRFLGDRMREGWQEMAALCRKMTDTEEVRMSRFLLSVVLNIGRMEPT